MYKFENINVLVKLGNSELTFFNTKILQMENLWILGLCPQAPS